VVGVVGVGYAVENEEFSGGGGNDFVGAGLLGGILRAERYRRSSSSEAYDLRSEVGVLVLDRGGSESENEPPPRVTADVGVGVRDLLTVLGEFEEGVRVNDRVGLVFIGEVEERLEEVASSNAGSGEKEDLGIVSCGGGAGRCVDATGDAGFVEDLGVGTGGEG
jgi:hypothetical protein